MLIKYRDFEWSFSMPQPDRFESRFAHKYCISYVFSRKSPDMQYKCQVKEKC